MKILLVEDHLAKRMAIKDFVLKEFPDDTLEEADCLIHGLRKARDLEPDYILLDMSLPNYPSKDRGTRATDMRPFAGTEFLRRIRRMNFDTKVLIVSMFETFGVAPSLITLNGLDEEMSERYPDIYLSAIHYATSNDEWQSHIKKFHSAIEANK